MNMQYTSNLNLKKPEYTDPADIADINDNMDTLDAKTVLGATPTAATAPVDTNTTQVATCQFVLNQAGDTVPEGLGTAAAGTSESYARKDHVHPIGIEDSNINAQTGTTYTLVLTDNGKFIKCTNAASITLTVPPNSSVAFPIGAEISVMQNGAGAITFAQGSGVTIRSKDTNLTTNGQYVVVALKKLATNEWVLAGDLT
jgi:hypothetical protein